MKNKILGYGIGTFGSAILGLSTLPLLTKFFSAEDVGRVSMLQVAISFGVLVFSLGLDQAYVREFYDPKSSQALFKMAILPGFILSITTLIFIYIISPTFVSKSLYDIPSSYLSIISIICFLSAFTSRFLALILRMRDRALAYSISQILPRFISLVFILFIIYFNISRDTYHLISGEMISIAAAFFILGWNTRKDWLKAFRNKIDIQHFKALLHFGFPLIFGGLASWGLNVMDKIFLRWMSNFAELGIYSITMMIAGGASIVTSIFNTIWSPMVYKWINEGADLKKIDEISEHVLAALYFIIVLSGLFSWMLPIFFPPQYQPIQYLISTCLMAPLLYTLSETTAVGIAITRKTYFSMLASFIAMLSNAAGNFLLIPKYGAVGASTSTAISFAIFYLCRTEFSKIVWREIPRKKSYLTISLLLFVSIFNTFFLKGNYISITIFGILFFLGLIIFKHSILSTLYLLKKNQQILI